ncbi:ATP-dependent helicase [Chelativorans xinjiangense]|uniref:ATP-dependent helicase n=1 Tax=Chelativorans xinjiangense TaxID=2681485 RepID=UPI001FE9B89F|nr:ATP-dependent helicase [Chelativorans xinjiangense]
MPWSDRLAIGSPAHQIASSTNPRVRVVAGPGTGKSFAMKRRVARLLEQGVEPAVILPVTFTRVAAEDLHRELVSMDVEGSDGLTGVTLHSLAMRMLMRNHVLGATGRVPRPLNDFELEPLICDLMAAHGGKKAVKKFKQAYEAAWSRLQHEQPGYVLNAEDAAFQQDLLGWLRFHRAMLIGEVIPQLYQYLRNNPAAQERSEFQHILVDEYQDLNRAEQSVVELLSDQAHVCIVGDDDQSIYSFKHAHPDGIREWLVVNASADDLGLDDCRRCPTRVVQMANSLIGHNQIRPVPRALVTMPANGPGDVRIIQYPSLANEVNGVANIIAGMVANGTPPGDILVLAQRGVIGTPIYEALVARHIPVRSYYAEAELDAPEARRAFAKLKLLINRDDRVALRWLVGIDGNNWHAAGYRRVRQHCEASGLTPWQALEQIAAGNPALPHTGGIVVAFNNLVAELNALEALPDLAAIVNTLFPQGQLATRDIRQLSLDILAEMDMEDDVEGEDVRSEFLARLQEAINQPEIPSEIQDVRIMSLHKSKGLSAPVTIIAGCIQGLLPKQPDNALPAVQQALEMEEQRRLFYVGITRVKAAPNVGSPGTLILTYSQTMPVASALGAGIAPAQMQYGLASLHASQFIAELGPAAPQAIAG